MTIEEKIIETIKLENKLNFMRNELYRLQNIKNEKRWKHEDTGEIDEQIELAKEDISPLSQAFELSLNEIGSDNYYNYVRGEKNDRHKTY